MHSGASERSVAQMPSETPTGCSMLPRMTTRSVTVLHSVHPTQSHSAWTHSTDRSRVRATRVMHSGSPRAQLTATLTETPMHSHAVRHSMTTHSRMHSHSPTPRPRVDGSRESQDRNAQVCRVLRAQGLSMRMPAWCPRARRRSRCWRRQRRCDAHACCAISPSLPPS